MQKSFFQLLTLASLFLALLIGCQQESSSPQVRPEIQSLVNEASEIQYRTGRNQLFANTSIEDLNTFKRQIHNIQKDLLYLNSYPESIVTYKRINRAIRIIRSLQIQKQDEFYILDFIRRATTVVSNLAKQYKVQSEMATVPLFTTYFGGPLTPFSTTGKSSEWVKKLQAGDRNVVTASGLGASAWLISPTFDFSKVERPSLIFTHKVQISNDSKRNINELEIADEAFQLFISTNFDQKTSDPYNFKAVNWEKISLGVYPDSQDHNTVDSPEISLEKYAGKKVTFAFLYNNNTRHYLGWTLNFFQVLGIGNISYEIKPADILTLQLSSTTLEPFSGLQASDKAPTWNPGSFGKDTYSIIHVEHSESRSWLVSPQFINNGQTDLSLKVKEIAKLPSWKNFIVLVSTNYQGGAVQDADWSHLVRESWPDTKSNKFKPYTNAFPSLGSLVGKENFTLAFVLNDSKDIHQDSAWEVSKLTFLGIGKPLSYKTWSEDLVPSHDGTPVPFELKEPNP